MKRIPDPLNDPPPSEEEKRRRDQVLKEKTCPECKQVSWRGHFAWCSESPVEVQVRYAERMKP